jgi:hypothetical protein
VLIREHMSANGSCVVRGSVVKGNKGMQTPASSTPGHDVAWIEVKM